MGDDLPDDRRDRVAVAENPALDLDAVDAFLDQHLVVVATRQLDRSDELLVTAHLRDADGRAEACGLHEHGVREVVCGLVAVAQRDVACDRDSPVAEDRLEEVLVHAERRRSDTSADVRHACEFEQPLHRSVLAERAVQDREHDVDLAEGCCGGRLRDDGERLDAGSGKRVVAARELPAARLVDLDDDGLVPLGIERGDHRARRRERDLVLARTTAREHGHANAWAHGIGVVSVVVSVVVVGSTKRPTKRVTIVFGSACDPPTGSCAFTMPSSVKSSVSS